MTGLATVVDRAEVVLCCGTGGVGKTTTAAALALEGARRGRNTVVVTIDPAKRLADALGISALTNEPHEIDRALWDPDGRASPGGSLAALMLDVEHTFEQLVRRYSDTPEQAERILENPVYRNLANTLSGTQEYMAAEKLYELHERHRFDLIVIDTPPSRHALDFLDAPDRLLRLLDHRLFRILMGSTRAGLRIASTALQRVFRAAARAAGPEVIDDIVAFLQAFEGMETGFRERAAEVVALVERPSTVFVVVTSPRRDALDEARYFTERLEEDGLSVEAMVVNRVHADFGGPGAEQARAIAESVSGTVLGDYLCNLADFTEVSERERDLVGRESAATRAGTLVFVPFLPDDVHDIKTLHRIGHALVGVGSAPS